MINTRIITHPLNWAIIILMLVIAGMGGHLLLSFLEQEPARADDSEQPQGYTTEQVEPFMSGFGGMASLAAD
jgi:hypothetical protein